MSGVFIGGATAIATVCWTAISFFVPMLLCSVGAVCFVAECQSMHSGFVVTPSDSSLPRYGSFVVTPSATHHYSRVVYSNRIARDSKEGAQQLQGS